MESTVASPTPVELAQRVTRAMLVRKVPPTPQNYHVWYHYIAQTDADLANTIDALIHTSKPFTEQVNAELYKSYILSKCADEQVRKIQQEMQTVLADIMENISSVGEATKDYGNHLETSANRLSTTAEAHDVRGVLRLLADRTISMARTAKESRQSLQTATAQIVTLNEQLKETEQAVLHDPLTGLYNRKGTDQRLRELEESFHGGHPPFSVIMADIDHFKKFNDTFGHQVGDAVLRLVGKVLKDSVKGKDFIARYGGEEFIAVLPGTLRDGAGVVAEQIRAAVQAQRFRIARTDQEIPKITLSLGVAQFAAGDNSERVIYRADQALYFAKRSGRNNVKAEHELPHSA